jgi:hypothetical protein
VRDPALDYPFKPQINPVSRQMAARVRPADRWASIMSTTQLLGRRLAAGATASPHLHLHLRRCRCRAAFGLQAMAVFICNWEMAHH